MSYRVITDPSGALLPDINNITYRNYNLDLSPTYDYTYQLRNSVGGVVANEFYPFSFPVSTSLSSTTLYLTRNSSNTIYGANYSAAPYYVKIVNSNLISADIPSYVRGASCAFDSSGILYTPSYQGSGFSQITRIFKTLTIENVMTTTEFFVAGPILRNILGLDFDSYGNLYLADSYLNQIVKVAMVDYDNGIGSIFIPTYTGLTIPVDIKFDIYNNAYIANNGVSNIIKVTSDETISVFATGLTNITEITYNIVDSTIYAACGNKINKIINGVVSVVVDLSLNSYLSYGIVSTTTGEVYYSATKVPFSLGNTLTEIFKIIPNNNFDLTYTSPNPAIISLAFGTNGKLYSAQYTSHGQFNNLPPQYGRIYASGDNINPFYPTNQYTSDLNNPSSIALDSLNNVYVASSSVNSLFVINSTGTTKTLVTITGAPLSEPSSIAFNGTGQLYIANSINNTICILTFSNTSTATSVLLDISGATILTPAGIAFDASYNNLYVSSSGNHNILKVDLLATPKPVASIYNLHGVSINSPSGLYFNNTTGILYVSDLDTSKIIQITNNNTASYVNITPNATIEFSLPMGLIMDTSNNLYIANYGGSYPGILKLNINITITSAINAGLLNFPSDTAMAPTTKYIYISNEGNNNIDLFTSSGTLSVYATLAEGVPSVTINITSSRLYLLYDSGLVKTINSGGTLSNVNVTGTIPSAGAQCIRFRPRVTPIAKDILYITDTSNNRIIKVPLTTPSAGIGEVLNIINFPPNFKPVYLAFDSNNNMYMCAGSNLDSAYNSQSVYKINLTTLIATLYITIPESSQLKGIDGIAFDSKNYMYSICKFNIGVKQLLFRTTPDGSTTQLMHTFQEAPLFVSFTSINYVPWEDALVMTGNNRLYKVYLSYIFTGMLGQLGPLDDTLFIFDVTNAANNFDVSFNVYTPYIVIDPSNVAQNSPTDVTFHFLSPVVGPGLGPAIPAPTDSYILTCNGTKVSNVFCNNCTYNKTKFLAGTYPTGLVYSTDTTFLYVALQNNTISRVSVLGVVDNNYFPPNLGLVGPTSLVLDASFDMFVLNAGSDFISYITLRDNIISVNNSFFTGIYVPICLTYDADTDSLYLLSGAVPNTRITKINARTGVGEILPLAFGALYDPNGLTIDAYYGLFAPLNNQPPNIKYLYVSNQDQNKNNQIKRVDLTTTDSNGNILYGITTLVSGLTYKPYTMTNQNDGYLYVANKTSNNISKISLTGLAPNIQPWASSGISVPCDLCFDNFGNLYVANSGTSPRNSRISKIYTDDFFFTDVMLTNGTCSNAQIYDITTQSCVEVDYYQPPSNPCSFPIPIPYPIGSG